MSNLNVKIYVCHHKDAPVYQTNCLVPIQVGDAQLLSIEHRASSIEHRASSIEHRASSMLRDNTGDNIAEKNKSFAELTALYHLWKNVDADYYGLFHYRRFFNFNVSTTETEFNVFDDETIAKFGWKDECIQDKVKDYDIVVSPFFSICRPDFPSHIFSMYEHYAYSHRIQDLEIILRIIKNKYPEMYRSSLNSVYSKGFLLGNMMIMKKEYFEGYCHWLFDILFEAEKHIQVIDGYQQRVFGFLGERLLTIYINYLKEIEKKPLILHTNIVNGAF